MAALAKCRERERESEESKSVIFELLYSSIARTAANSAIRHSASCFCKVQRERESEECKSESEIRVQQYSIAMTAANSAIRWWGCRLHRQGSSSTPPKLQRGWPRATRGASAFAHSRLRASPTTGACASLPASLVITNRTSNMFLTEKRAGSPPYLPRTPRKSCVTAAAGGDECFWARPGQ